VCEIERFGHPLAIAFTLSALFYYVELRKEASKWTSKVLENHREELAKNRERLSSVILGVPDARWPRLITALKAKVAERKSRRIFLAEDFDVVLLLGSIALWLGIFKFRILGTRVSVHTNAWTSTIVSLGALIYAGYVPGEISCGIMTLILVLSFYSIAWNLWIFFVYLPILDFLIRRSDKLVEALMPR
jgi:hypothetical protein